MCLISACNRGSKFGTWNCGPLLQALCNILTNNMSDPCFPFSATTMSCLARGETVNGPKVFSFETLPRAARQLGGKKECTFILDATLLAISKTKNTTKTTNNGPQAQLLQVWRSIWADKNEGNFQFQKHTDIKKSLEENDVGVRGLLFINPPLPMTLQATEFLSSYIVNLLLLHTSSFSLLTWIHVHVES